MKFAIVVFREENYIHSQVFSELEQLLLCSLRDLGHDVEVSINQPIKDAVNIILGFLHLDHFEKFTHVKTIYFQLEPLTQIKHDERKQASYNAIKKWIDSADYIWEYSENNLSEYNGQTVSIVPIGYNKALEVIEKIPVKERAIDILFFGSITEKRNKALIPFRHSKFNYQQVFGVYGKERDDLIANSKIVLNIHKDDSNFLETTRVSYLLNNGCFCLTETSDAVYDKIDIESSDIETLYKTAEKLLFLPKKIEILSAKQHAAFKEHYNMSTILETVLQNTIF